MTVAYVRASGNASIILDNVRPQNLLVLTISDSPLHSTDSLTLLLSSSIPTRSTQLYSMRGLHAQ